MGKLTRYQRESPTKPRAANDNTAEPEMWIWLQKLTSNWKWTEHNCGDITDWRAPTLFVQQVVVSHASILFKVRGKPPQINRCAQHLFCESCSAVKVNTSPLSTEKFFTSHCSNGLLSTPPTLEEASGASSYCKFPSPRGLIKFLASNFGCLLCKFPCCCTRCFKLLPRTQETFQDL